MNLIENNIVNNNKNMNNMSQNSSQNSQYLREIQEGDQEEIVGGNYDDDGNDEDNEQKDVDQSGLTAIMMSKKDKVILRQKFSQYIYPGLNQKYQILGSRL